MKLHFQSGKKIVISLILNAHCDGLKFHYKP